MEVFSSHFAGEYEVYKTKLMMRDFVVKKSGWTGVGVKLQQEANATTFVFTPLTPSVPLQMLAGFTLGLISYLFLRPGYKALEDEVRLFIENAADFR